MKILKRPQILTLILLLTLTGSAELLAKKGGNPGGDGGGGGACSVIDNWSTLFYLEDDFSDPNTRSLGMEMAAAETGSDILLVATAHEGTDVQSSEKAIEVFSFSGGAFTHIQSLPYPSYYKAYQQLVLADIDGDGPMDLLLGSPGVNRVLFYSDVAAPSTTPVEIVGPTEGDTLGTSFGDGLAFGEFDNQPGNEIAIGADQYFDQEGRVFVYSVADFSLLGVLSSPEPTGSDRFGSALATGPGFTDLFVAAKWADVGNKREAGKVFEYSGGVHVETYERGNRHENLGDLIAVTSDGDLAGDTGDGLAFFPANGGGGSFDLPMPADKLIQHLAAADINGSWGDDLLSGRPNTDPDAGSCWNTGSAFVYLDPVADQGPITLRSPKPIDGNNLFFGWAAAAASGTVFVSERGRNVDEDANPEGIIYAFTF